MSSRDVQRSERSRDVQRSERCLSVQGQQRLQSTVAQKSGDSSLRLCRQQSRGQSNLIEQIAATTLSIAENAQSAVRVAILIYPPPRLFMLEGGGVVNGGDGGRFLTQLAGLLGDIRQLIV